MRLQKLFLPSRGCEIVGQPVWVIRAQLLCVTVESFFTDRGVGGEKAEGEGGVVDAAEQFVESAVDVGGVADGFFEGGDETWEFLGDGRDRCFVLPLSGFEKLLGLCEMGGRVRDQESALALHRGDGETTLGDEVLKMGGFVHEAGEPRDIGRAVFGSDQVFVPRSEYAVFSTSEKATGAQKIVVQKLAVRKASTGLAEEGLHFRIIENAPARQTELEASRPEVVRPLDALDDGGQRGADESDHGLHAVDMGFIEEHPSDGIELRLRDSVAFARCAEDIEINNAASDLMAHAAAEGGFFELEVFIPRHTAGGEDAGAVAFSGIHAGVVTAVSDWLTFERSSSAMGLLE